MVSESDNNSKSLNLKQYRIRATVKTMMMHSRLLLCQISIALLLCSGNAVAYEQQDLGGLQLGYNHKQVHNYGATTFLLSLNEGKLGLKSWD